jgi:hypothetical protein
MRLGSLWLEGGWLIEVVIDGFVSSFNIYSLIILTQRGFICTVLCVERHFPPYGLRVRTV